LQLKPDNGVNRLIDQTTDRFLIDGRFVRSRSFRIVTLLHNMVGNLTPVAVIPIERQDNVIATSQLLAGAHVNLLVADE
jgi:hypothetical protein